MKKDDILSGIILDELKSLTKEDYEYLDGKKLEKERLAKEIRKAKVSAKEIKILGNLTPFEKSLLALIAKIGKSELSKKRKYFKIDKLSSILLSFLEYRYEDYVERGFEISIFEYTAVAVRFEGGMSKKNDRVSFDPTNTQGEA